MRASSSPQELLPLSPSCHEDALKSGLHAACRVGIAAQAKALIHSEGFAPQLNAAWASKVIRQTCPYS